MTIGATRLGMPPGFLNSAGQPSKPLPDTQALSSRLMVCEVHEVVAHAQAYVVRAPGMPRMTATTLADNATLFGVRDATTIVPGSFVLCYIQPDLPPIIIGAIRTPVGASNQAIPDSIVAAGNAGLFENKHHQDMITSTPDAHGLINFSGGVPIDVLPGDWGKFNELGLGVFLGKFMAFLRASDMCKVEAHYLDHMLRVFAYNYQHFTAGSEEEALNDEGEFTRIRGMTPYPWEALGIRNQGESAFGDPEQVDPVNASRLCVEPKEEMQTGFWRLREMEGYLGDLYRRTAAIPVADGPMVFSADKEDPSFVGVFDEHIAADGAFSIRSAKSVLLEKTCFIPVVEEKLPRDNPGGNVVSEEENIAGKGVELVDLHPGEADLVLLDDKLVGESHNTRSAVVTREKDWLFKDDEPKLVGKLTGEQSELGPYDGAEAELPKVGKQDVDHRRKGVKYFQSRARIYMTPDGGIVLEDGYGSCLRMHRGNIDISCPGDITLRSGRDTHTLAGRDASVHANKACDITASNEDVRIKAERNLMLLGGNDYAGSVVVEGRGAGIVSKSVFGSIVSLARQIELHSTSVESSPAGDGDDADPAMAAAARASASLEGGILLNADEGDADLDVVAGTQTTILKKGYTQVVAPELWDTPAEAVGVFENTSRGLTIAAAKMDVGTGSFSVFNSTQRGADARVNLKASVRIDGDIIGTDEYVDSNVAQGVADEAEDSVVERRNELRDERLAAAGGATGGENDASGAWQTAGGGDGEEAIPHDGLERLAGTAYAEEQYKRIGFSYRTTYGAARITEAPWQKRFRLLAGVTAGAKYGGKAFEVPGVIGPLTKSGRPVGADDPTMPFPGYAAWEGSGDEEEDPGVFVQYDDELYDWDERRPKPVDRETLGEPNGDNEDEPNIIVSPLKGRYPVNIPE